jgi:hypothetical protein
MPLIAFPDFVNFSDLLSGFLTKNEKIPQLERIRPQNSEVSSCGMLVAGLAVSMKPAAP